MHASDVTCMTAYQKMASPSDPFLGGADKWGSTRLRSYANVTCSHHGALWCIIGLSPNDFWFIAVRRHRVNHTAHLDPRSHWKCWYARSSGGTDKLKCIYEQILTLLAEVFRSFDAKHKNLFHKCRSVFDYFCFSVNCCQWRRIFIIRKFLRMSYVD